MVAAVDRVLALRHETAGAVVVAHGEVGEAVLQRDGADSGPVVRVRDGVEGEVFGGPAARLREEGRVLWEWVVEPGGIEPPTS